MLRNIIKNKIEIDLMNEAVLFTMYKRGLKAFHIAFCIAFFAVITGGSSEIINQGALSEAFNAIPEGNYLYGLELKDIALLNADGNMVNPYYADIYNAKFDVAIANILLKAGFFISIALFLLIGIASSFLNDKSITNQENIVPPKDILKIVLASIFSLFMLSSQFEYFDFVGSVLVLIVSVALMLKYSSFLDGILNYTKLSGKFNEYKKGNVFSIIDIEKKQRELKDQNEEIKSSIINDPDKIYELTYILEKKNLDDLEREMGESILEIYSEEEKRKAEIKMNNELNQISSPDKIRQTIEEASEILLDIEND